MKKKVSQILVNSEKYLPEFVALNEAWISEFFELEQIDLELAANPKKIIDDGGYVFTLLEKDCVVGVCALFNQGDGSFQLARMAVIKNMRGKGYSRLLMDAVLEKLKTLKASKVSLLSNSQLVAAIMLYEKYGFKVIKLGSHPIYKRVDIEMQLNLFKKEGL